MTDPKRGQFEVAAAAAAERLDRARAQGAQLSLLAAPATPADPGELVPRGPGRPHGSRNKRTSKLRQMLAARGFRMPEDVLAEVAGLSSRETAIELAMARAEQVLLWAYGPLATPSGAQRMDVFRAVYRELGDAAAALLPYGLEKMTPDQAASAAPTFIVMPGQAAQAAVPGDRAKVIDGTMAPPPMPHEIERNQAVSDAEPAVSDAVSRTEGLTR